MEPVVDPHVHLALEDSMQMVAEPHGIVDYRRVTDGIDLRHVGVLVMAPRDDLDSTRRLNDLVLELATGGPWFALCSVHPGDGDMALEEIDRVRAAGAKGLKLHPNTQDFDVGDDSVARVVAHAGEVGLPVLFDAYSPFDPAQPGKFLRLVIDHPRTQLVLAHMHFLEFPRLMAYEVLSRYPNVGHNVWFDMSATAKLLADSPFRDQFAWVCRRLGTDKLIWGSDYPLDDPTESLASLSAYGFGADELRAITHDNAAGLWGLER